MTRYGEPDLPGKDKEAEAGLVLRVRVRIRAPPKGVFSQ